MLPPIRDELALHPGPVAPDGSPGWTLHDPVRNAFFRIGWPAFEILARWGAGTAEAVCDRVDKETTLRIDTEEVAAISQFLLHNELVQARSKADSARLLIRAASRQQRWYTWLLHHYLFIRIPLVRPDRMLDRTVKYVSFLYSPGFLWATLGALALGAVMIVRQWDVFRATLVDTLTPAGLISYALSLTLVKTLHEFGHAYTSKRLGCRVPSMGLALLVLWPVLFTDVNETWRLPDRRDRLAVGVSGIAVELAIAAWCSVLWAFLPDGPVRQMAFVLAALTWVTSLTVNLSPFMRFDGYFLLMDAVNIPNLHQRAFATARWWMRRVLFDLDDPPPENFGPIRRNFLIGFAFSAWIYRTVLFLTIAVLVYHFFIKIVGVFLFAVELTWFILLPIAREVRLWHSVRRVIAARVRVRWTLAAGALALLALIVPWHRQIGASAMLKASDSQGLYLPVGGVLVGAGVTGGENVHAGQVLFVFESIDARQQQALIAARIVTLKYQLGAIAFDVRFREQSSALRDMLAAAYSEQAWLAAAESRMTVAAPADGTVLDVMPGLHAGDPVSSRDRLGLLRGGGAPVIDAYVTETDLSRIAIGDPARFYPDAISRPSIVAHVVAIDRAAIGILEDAELAHSHGGRIQVREAGTKLVPVTALYRVRLAPEGLPPPDIALRGVARISGLTESFLSSTLRTAAAVVLREWGS